MPEIGRPDVVDSKSSASSAPDDDVLPFVLRVAARWRRLDELPHPADGELFFRRRAPLTGLIALTEGGRDVQFSDIEV